MRIFGANLSREMVFISGKENAQIARNEKQFFPIRFLNVTAISLHHFIQKEGEGIHLARNAVPSRYTGCGFCVAI